jgi:hypothetical protein
LVIEIYPGLLAQAHADSARVIGTLRSGLSPDSWSKHARIAA